jgi:hypothetical protein
METGTPPTGLAHEPAGVSDQLSNKSKVGATNAATPPNATGSGMPSRRIEGQIAPPRIEGQTAPVTLHATGSVWYVDPVGIVMNSVRDDIDWQFDGSCTYNSSGGSSSISWNTGWNYDAYNDTVYKSCFSDSRQTYAHFYNGVFCALTTTDVWYNLNIIVGKYDGSFYHDWDTITGGQCAPLLRFQHSESSYK